MEARIDPYACGECGAEFQRGDSYMHTLIDGQEDVRLVVCIGCARPAASDE